MLTAKEQQTLEFIEQYFLKHNYAPTAAEIADGIGIHSRGVVHRYLRALERAGYLELVAGRRRNIRMCSQQHKPWVLPMVGQIAAGLPIEAIEQECSVDLRSRLPSSRSFLLQVKGESMVNEGIHDCDYVLCEQRETASNGEIVVALVDGNDATLKRFYNNDDGSITLVPANKAFSPIRYSADRITIQGIYKGLFRLDAA